MRRLVVFLVVAVGTYLAVRKMAESMGPAMREHCAEMCDRMLAGMPESFPPNRMMADLDTDISAMHLTLSAYLTGFALLHLLCGPLADRFGDLGHFHRLLGFLPRQQHEFKIVFQRQ